MIIMRLALLDADRAVRHGARSPGHCRVSGVGRTRDGSEDKLGLAILISRLRLGILTEQAGPVHLVVPFFFF